jgi:hypothetical protein
MISLERLLALADVYDVRPQHLVAALSQRLSTQTDRNGIPPPGSGSPESTRSRWRVSSGSRP